MVVLTPPSSKAVVIPIVGVVVGTVVVGKSVVAVVVVVGKSPKRSNVVNDTTSAPR